MKIAVFYHARICGGNPEINRVYGERMVSEQMRLFVDSGLYSNTNRCIIGLNGDGGEFMRHTMPEGCSLIEHGPKAESLLPTFLVLEEWAKTHPDWYVCIWHTKGVTHPHDKLNVVWRRCMENAVIRNWHRCVNDLENGCDSAGAHWLTREQFGPMVNTFFWGGAFYWVKASFLTQLPKLPTTVTCRNDWFIPENWIGMGPRPKVHDYAPHWPGLVACNQ